MKKLKKLLILGIFLSLGMGAFAQVNSNYHKVSGYYKSNGTYVQPYYRTNPNSTISDNYSTYPNINPWTGNQGTVKQTTNYNSSYNNSYYDNSLFNNSYNSTYYTKPNYYSW